uniref:Uncharacterized protein n=1 Tax=Rhizophora mucronata TaxID=61149 RepID=A0A2P2J7R7_RHIMU
MHKVINSGRRIPLLNFFWTSHVFGLRACCSMK